MASHVTESGACDWLPVWGDPVRWLQAQRQAARSLKTVSCQTAVTVAAVCLSSCQAGSCVRCTFTLKFTRLICLNHGGGGHRIETEILRLPRGRFRLNAFNLEEIPPAMVSVDPVWGPEGQFKGNFWNGTLNRAAVSELRRNEEQCDSFCYTEEMLSSHWSFSFFFLNVCCPHCWSCDVSIIYIGVLLMTIDELIWNLQKQNFIPGQKRRRVCKWGKRWAKELHGSPDADPQLTLTLPAWDSAGLSMQMPESLSLPAARHQRPCFWSSPAPGSHTKSE